MDRTWSITAKSTALKAHFTPYFVACLANGAGAILQLLSDELLQTICRHNEARVCRYSEQLGIAGALVLRDVR